MSVGAQTRRGSKCALPWSVSVLSYTYNSTEHSSHGSCSGEATSGQ